MGTIIARGGGFDASSEEIWAFVQFVKRCTGKETPHFLLVPTTAFDQVNKGTLNCYHKLGCRVDTLLLTADYMTPEIVRRKIGEADIIEVPGGNLKFAKEVWERTGAEDLIKEAFMRGAVLTGSSAGAMIWFKQGYDNCGLYDSQMFTPGIGLIPYAVCPHYDEVFWKSFDARVPESGLSGVALENGAAYCVMPDGSTQILRASGGKKAWFFDAENGYAKRKL